MINWQYFVVFYLWVSLTEAGNIFAIIPYTGKSHLAVIKPLLETLAKKGHNIDVATHYPCNSTIPGYNEISLVGSRPIFNDNLSVHSIKDFSTYHFMQFMGKTAGVDLCEAVLKWPTVQKVIYSRKKYDLFITEILGADCMLGFAHIFDTPIVYYAPTINLPWASDTVGTPDNPSYVPNILKYANPVMSFYDRVENTILLILTKYLFQYMTSGQSDQIGRKFFGPHIPQSEVLARNTSLYLVNSHFSMNYARPSAPNFIEVGGVHIQKPKPLSKHFETLLSGSSVIYLTMGSMIQTETFDSDKLQAMFDAFAQLPYRVLWKADVEKFPKDLSIPGNIHFEKWMPQIDILCHPNVKLFVTHGGLLSSQEAVYCAVPRLGIPIFIDQETNIHSAENLGIGIKIAYGDITKDRFLLTIEKLLHDSSYKKNVERVSQLFKDRSMSPLDTAVFWVEYVMKHRGFPNVQKFGSNSNRWQFKLVDVGVILLFMLFVSGLVMRLVHLFKTKLLTINVK